jgi:hypothetical protein
MKYFSYIYIIIREYKFQKKRVMKKLVIVIAGIIIFNNSFTQTYIINDLITRNELIESKSGYKPDVNYIQNEYLKSLLSGDITVYDIYAEQLQLDVVTVTIHLSNYIDKTENFISYYSKFNFKQYSDTTKFIIEYQTKITYKGSTTDPDADDFVLIPDGYKEIVSIKDINGDYVLKITFYYLPQSSIISGSTILTADRIQ